MGYFTGVKTYPDPVDADKPTAAESAKIDEWEYQDFLASYYLRQKLPDAIAMRLLFYPSTKERWAAISYEFQAKSMFKQDDLHQSFLDMCCAKGGDVREYLSSLYQRRDELAAAEVHITDIEYRWTILRGIPSELATFASHVISSGLVHNQTPANTNVLIHQIRDGKVRFRTMVQI